jgi:hypothetical protein
VTISTPQMSGLAPSFYPTYAPKQTSAPTAGKKYSKGVVLIVYFQYNLCCCCSCRVIITTVVVVVVVIVTVIDAVAAHW